MLQSNSLFIAGPGKVARAKGRRLWEGYREEDEGGLSPHTDPSKLSDNICFGLICLWNCAGLRKKVSLTSSLGIGSEGSWVQIEVCICPYEI